MARAIERLFLPLMQQTIPEVIDYRLPFAGVAHNLMLVKIRKSYPGQARKVAHAVWGLGQAMFTKVICVVDETAPDMTDEPALARHIIERVNFARDVEFVLGPTETLDHATRALHFGSKVSLDATRKLPGEELTGLFLASEGPAAMPPLDGLGLAGHWEVGGVHVLEIQKQRGYQAQELARELFQRAKDAPLPPVVVLEAGLVTRGSGEELVWAALANMDPERDCIFDERPQAESSGRVRLARHTGRLVIDATSKDSRDGFARDWPRKQTHAPEVLARVRELLGRHGLAV